jgi:colanic acid/amylovoran biosynthesis glycosyltransferase
VKSKKNILIVSPHKIGQTETFIRAHIDQLYGNVFYLYGWDLDLKTEADVSLKELYKPKSSFLTKFKSLLPHYIYFRLLQKQKKNYTKEALIKRYIKEHHIDVVMAEYGTAGSFITPICKNLDIPLLVHFHGFDASRKDTLNNFKKGYELMFSYATKIIVVSNAMKQALVGQGCPEKKLVLNTYGPHPYYLNIEPNLESNFIISVGRHTYKKAPYLTILAFQKVLKKHPHLKLKMIGDGELFDVSKNLVKSLGLENNIILLGGLERKEIVKHLEKAFLFLQHSIVASNGDSEGTPVGIIEAMAAGLPVVSTRHAGIPDVVIENKTGFLVDEGDINTMAKAIIKLAENRKLLSEFGTNGKVLIEKNFTLEKHINILNDIIIKT